jgi:transcription initiation factor TFIIB
MNRNTVLRTEQLGDQAVCPECGGKSIIIDNYTGEKICGSCGLVMADSMMSEDPEWRASSQDEEERRSRVGMPLSFSFPDKGLGTTISWVGKDVYRRNIPLDAKLQMLRLRNWQMRSGLHSHRDRNLAKAMAELSRLADKLHIPKPVRERAAVIYRKALEKDLLRGRNISAVAAASLYAACRVTSTPRILREFGRQGTVDEKDIARCYRLLLRELTMRMPVSKAQFRVPVIAAKENISEKTQQIAINILRRAEKERITFGKNPLSLAAAALYIACMMNKEGRTQEMIAHAADVSGVTIRNRYKELELEI